MDERKRRWMFRTSIFDSWRALDGEHTARSKSLRLITTGTLLSRIYRDGTSILIRPYSIIDSSSLLSSCLATVSSLAISSLGLTGLQI
jgi:hypothetical protein